VECVFTSISFKHSIPLQNEPPLHHAILRIRDPLYTRPCTYQTLLLSSWGYLWYFCWYPSCHVPVTGTISFHGVVDWNDHSCRCGGVMESHLRILGSRVCCGILVCHGLGWIIEHARATQTISRRVTRRLRLYSWDDYLDQFRRCMGPDQRLAHGGKHVDWICMYIMGKDTTMEESALGRSQGNDTTTTHSTPLTKKKTT